MINFKIGKITVSLEFGFFAAAAVFCLLDAPELALSAVCACVIHESGHIFASIICNIKIERIILWAGGVKMQTESRIVGTSRDILILLMGPAFNFAAALLYYYSQCYSPFSVNLILGLFNLLPFSDLDGGAILRKIFEHFEIFSDKLLRITALLTAIAVILFFYFTGSGNLTGCLTIIFLAICELFC